MVARDDPEMIRIDSSLRERGVNFHDATGLFKNVETPISCDPYCHDHEEGVRMLSSAMDDHLLKTIPAGATMS